VPPKTSFSRAEARESAWRIRQMSHGVRLGGLHIKDLIDEDRR
jgi:hypothetical protein